MQFNEVVGQNPIKAYLKKPVETNKIPHAQLFIGPEGSGTLPMALSYAREILCSYSKDKTACELKFNSFTHPDLHFVYPVSSNDEIKSHPVSKLFLKSWIELIQEQPYCNLFDWYKKIGIEKKQGQIGVDEAHDIVKTLSLKSYEGGYKVMIIWMAERMNGAASNKLLKLIEEPPNKTIFLLIVEDKDQLINTITSRCQALEFPKLSENDIKSTLVSRYDVLEAEAQKIAQQSDGNFNKACDLIYQDSEDLQFEKWFVVWVRAAFRAKGNKSVVHDLLAWSEEISKTGRETQKEFLKFCLELFRQALLMNYKAEELVYFKTSLPDFNLSKFAPFVHEGNILEINDAIQDAIYHIERNGNAKLILTDTSLKLTRLLHKKSTTSI